MSQHLGPASLSRAFRFAATKTPEPSDKNEEEARVPSPPRPRLRLKRRNVSHHLSAPTQQFLASVAAADIPVPSIEESGTPLEEYDPNNVHPPHVADPAQTHARTRLALPGRALSPPRTPAPGLAPSSSSGLITPGRPNWTVNSPTCSSLGESSPEYESSRPSTSRSTQTSASLFSRLSHLSDDDNCSGLGFQTDGKFVLRDEGTHARGGAATLLAKSRKAPWTKAMDTHLWSTFVLYLQDPKVTPFRMGNSCIPPHGVCLRVAREAKRSWKGSRVLRRAANPADGKKSGSSTPVAEGLGAYMEWPHTCAATRAHLRDLCKAKATSGAQSVRLMSRSPAPSSQIAARPWIRRPTPLRSPVTFSTQDISMSLALSTSECMQPDGPLAQLTGLAPEAAVETAPTPATEPVSPGTPGLLLGSFDGEPSPPERQRLGSPAGARSYGPSSSDSLAATLGLSNTTPRRRTNTVGQRRLQSPVRLSRSSTQRRRNTQSDVTRRRPSLGTDIWQTGPTRNGPRVDKSCAVLQPSSMATSGLDLDQLFIPKAPLNQPQLASPASMPYVGAQLVPPPSPPPRLGSPFTGDGSSFSFPRRTHRPQPGSVDLGMLGRPFATIQQPTDAAAAPSRVNLADRLAYIDQRLQEFRSRDMRRRSESPL